AQLGQLGPAYARLGACGADAELVDLAKVCLSGDPSGRPADGSAVAQAVGAYRGAGQERLGRGGGEGAAAAQRVLGERQKRRVALALMGVVALVLALGLAATWHYYGEARQQAQAALANADDRDTYAGLMEAEAEKARQNEGAANRNA